MLHDISTLRGPTCYVYPQQRREEELRVAEVDVEKSLPVEESAVKYVTPQL